MATIRLFRVGSISKFIRFFFNKSSPQSYKVSRELA